MPLGTVDSKFWSDTDNDSSEAGFTHTQKRQKSDSDKEPATTAHNTNQNKGLHQNTDNNEASDWNPDDILDRMVEPKRSVPENQTNLSLLDIEQEFELDNEVGPPVNDQLAKVLKTTTKGKMDENKIKEKSEKHKRPSSVEQPVVPNVNPEIWGILDHNTKTADLKLKRKKTMLIKAIKAYFELKRISSIRRFLTEDATNSLVTSSILSRLDYCNCLLMGTPNSVIQPLQKIQNFAAKLVLLAPRHHHSTPLLEKLHWLPISERIKYKVACMCFSAINGSGPA